MGRERKYSREQGDRTVRRVFSGFVQGTNTDSDYCAMEQGEVPYLENLLPFRSELKLRKGLRADSRAVPASFPGSTLLGAWYSDQHGKTLFIVGGTLYAQTGSASQPVALGDGFSTNAIFIPVGNEVLVVDGDGFARVTENSLTASRQVSRSYGPTNPTVSISGANPQGTHKYRFLFTYARILNIGGTDTVVAETETKWVTGTTLDDYSEVVGTMAIGSGGVLSFSSTSIPSDPCNWTHLGIYRTLDIGIDPSTGVTWNGNSSEEYYQLGYVDPLGLLSLVRYGIGSMVVGTTAASGFRVGPASSLLITSDNDLVKGAAPLLRTRLMRPLPMTIPMESAPGFLFSCDASKVVYSETGRLSTQFLYDPAIQFYDTRSSVNAIKAQPGRITVFGSHQVVVGSTSSASTTSTDSLVGAESDQLPARDLFYGRERLYSDLGV